MDFSGRLGLCAKDAKGIAKKATTINPTIFFIIHFPPIDNNAGSPSRVPYVRNAIGGLYVVNSRYSFSCELTQITPAVVTGAAKDWINCYRGLKVVSQALLRFSFTPEPEKGLYDGSSGSVASGYVVSASALLIGG
jgi:hypothetical protein